MAIRTFATAVDDTAYVKVGSNVTVFSATERIVGEVRVIVTGVGDAQPAVGEANYVPFDENFSYGGDAADIWMISPLGATTVYGLV